MKFHQGPQATPPFELLRYVLDNHDHVFRRYIINLSPVRYSLRLGLLLTHITWARVGAAGEISLTGRLTFSTMSLPRRCLVVIHIPPLLILISDPDKRFPANISCPSGKTPVS